MHYLPCLRPLLVLLSCLLVTSSALADDLVSVFQLAVDSDPEYQAALDAHMAALEIRPQSRAALLPDIGLRGDVSRNRFDPRGNDDTSYSTNHTYSVGLRQALYQRQRFIQL